MIGKKSISLETGRKHKDHSPTAKATVSKTKCLLENYIMFRPNIIVTFHTVRGQRVSYLSVQQLGFAFQQMT